MKILLLFAMLPIVVFAADNKAVVAYQSAAANAVDLDSSAKMLYGIKAIRLRVIIKDGCVDKDFVLGAAKRALARSFKVIIDEDAPVDASCMIHCARLRDRAYISFSMTQVMLALRSNKTEVVETVATIYESKQWRDSTLPATYTESAEEQISGLLEYMPK